MATPALQKVWPLLRGFTVFMNSFCMYLPYFAKLMPTCLFWGICYDLTQTKDSHQTIHDKIAVCIYCTVVEMGFNLAIKIEWDGLQPKHGH